MVIAIENRKKRIEILLEDSNLTHEDIMFTVNCTEKEISDIEEYNSHFNHIKNNKPVEREFGDPAPEPSRETLESRILKEVNFEGNLALEGKYNLLNEKITKLILFRDSIKTLDFSPKTEMCIYENGVYKRRASNIIQSIIKTTIGELGKKFTITRLRDIMKQIELETLCDLDDFDKDPYIINVENCLVDIRTGDSKPHTPEYLSFRRIPIKYDSEALCPEIEIFFKEIFHKKDINFMYEFCGLCLTPIMEFQKAIMLYGVGNNGKTTFLNLLTTFIGEKNKSGVALHQLNSFMSARLDRSLINVDSDQGSNKMLIKMFKQWVGNELSITINPKYMTPYDIQPNAKLVYSCNNVFPNVPNDTDKGFWRKWDLIECPNSFDKNQNKDKLSELITDSELSGFFNICMKSFQTLLKRGEFEEQYQNNWESVKTFWLARMNPFNLFIERYGEIGEYKNAQEEPENEFWEFKEVTLKQFNLFLQKELNQKSITLANLTKTINESIYFNVERRTLGNKRVYVYQGFKLNNYEDKFKINNEDSQTIEKDDIHSRLGIKKDSKTKEITEFNQEPEDTPIKDTPKEEPYEIKNLLLFNHILRIYRVNNNLPMTEHILRKKIRSFEGNINSNEIDELLNVSGYFRVKNDMVDILLNKIEGIRSE